MDVNDELKSFAEYLRKIDLSGQLATGLFQDSTVLLNHGEETVILRGDSADRYNELVSSLHEAISSRRAISKRAVTRLVSDALMRAVKMGDRSTNSEFDANLNEVMRDLKRDLFEKPRAWDVYLVVEGLAPSGLPVKVGSVDFEWYSEPKITALKDRLSEVMISRSSGRDSGAQRQIIRDTERIKEKAIAELSVTAVDANAALDTARRKLQTTIDSINFYASRERLGGWAFLPGDAVHAPELQIAISDHNDLQFGYSHSGPTRKIPLNQLASRPGFQRISDMLAKENPTELEERILASFQWAGRAQVEQRREEAFLLYAIALESLVLGRNTKTEISHQLAVRLFTSWCWSNA
jgi:hypothetical protein